MDAPTPQTKRINWLDAIWLLNNQDDDLANKTNDSQACLRIGIPKHSGFAFERQCIYTQARPTKVEIVRSHSHPLLCCVCVCARLFLSLFPHHFAIAFILLLILLYYYSDAIFLFSILCWFVQLLHRRWLFISSRMALQRSNCRRW